MESSTIVVRDPKALNRDSAPLGRLGQLMASRQGQTPR